jgi:hypothetical protein
MPKFTSTTLTQDIAIFASSGGEGVHGESTSLVLAAIAGIQTNTAPNCTGAGVYGESRGVGAGAVGFNLVIADPGPSGPGGPGGPGGFFKSEQKEGVVAESKSLTNAAIAGFQNNPTSTGAAIYGEHITGGTAGFFKGNVIVTGDISFPGADFAEDFNIGADADIEPGAVMALDQTGCLVPCAEAYDTKVVGVVAGAGSHKTAIRLDRRDNGAMRRQPIALVGKVFCKVDATYCAISVGDLLTSSKTRGHAMKAGDQSRAFGAVIGKAMAPLDDGLGLIPILISLQ